MDGQKRKIWKRVGKGILGRRRRKLEKIPSVGLEVDETARKRLRKWRRG